LIAQNLRYQPDMAYQYY
jgi:hypothetical protein